MTTTPTSTTSKPNAPPGPRRTGSNTQGRPAPRSSCRSVPQEWRSEDHAGGRDPSPCRSWPRSYPYGIAAVNVDPCCAPAPRGMPDSAPPVGWASLSSTIKGFEGMRALRKGQAGMVALQGDIVGEARIVELAFGLGPCALTEAMAWLQDRLANAES